MEFVKKTEKKLWDLPEIRTLKVQGKPRGKGYSQKMIPEIKLCGEWLAKLGFAHNQQVSITAMKKLLVITLDE